MNFTSSFWGFVETVKQKSEEIVNIVQEDLSEFSKTIVDDTTTVVQEKLADLQIDKKDTKRSKTSQRNQNQYQARIALLQKDEHTYIDQPTDPTFEDWASSFNIGAHTETITHLLTSNESVREFHTRLVPAQVSYRDFWCRYYFRLHKLEQEEQRRAALVKSTIENDEEDFNWDDEDDSKHSDKTDEAKDEAPKKTERKEEHQEENKEEKAVHEEPKETKVESQPDADTKPQEEPATTTTATTTTTTAPTAQSQESETKPEAEATTEAPKETTAEVAAPTESEPLQDDIDREIEQKYLQIQSSPSKSSKLAADEDEEWGSWD